MRCCSITVRSFSRGSRPIMSSGTPLLWSMGTALKAINTSGSTRAGLRVRAIRQTLLFLDALPKFMGTATGEESMGYALKYTGDYFKADKIGSEERPGRCTASVFQ